MTSNSIPAGVRAADLGRFALRAAQVDKAKPVVAYWCNFYIVNQIISRGLHNSDDEMMLYTTNLVNRLEQFKSEHPDNDTILDSVAASAYVEQFGLEVFGRADAAMRADKVTKQTADTFQAAATFLELLQIWAESPDAEIAAKIKFAKYHALRIAKAIKNGEDPNATNPRAHREELLEQPPIDPTDPEAEQMMDKPVTRTTTTTMAAQPRPRQPSVEEIPDESDSILREMALRSTADESIHPSRSSSMPPPAAAAASIRPTLPSAASHEPPTSPSMQDHSELADSTEEPATTSLELPSAPESLGAAGSPFVLPDTPAAIGKDVGGPSSAPSSSLSGVFQSFPPPTSLSPFSDLPGGPRDLTASTHQFTPDSLPHTPSEQPQPPSRPAVQGPPHFAQQQHHHRHLAASTTHPPTASTSSHLTSQSSAPTASTTVDDQAIALAQKHARWAVSALTFDDVQTAVKELRTSLRHLGVE